MLLHLLSLALATTPAFSLATPPVGPNYVGGYVLFGDPAKLALLAQNAATLPVNRVWLSFVRPDMYYVPGSNSLIGVGLNYNETQQDHGFAEIKQYVQQLQAGGVEVFASMGGWDYNCWPWAYALNSIFNYGSSTPTYQSTIQKYGGGNMANCNVANQFCYACEPPSNGNTYDSFSIFPEPANSPTWQQAQAYVTSGSKMGQAPVWHPELLGGASYQTPSNGVVTVPGNNTWSVMGRDPYQDLVYMAKDLGLDGVDIDYEEFWHADTFKTDSSAQKNCGNGCTLFQTVYKYSAILQDVRINIQNIYPTLKLSTAASAAGAWPGTWWGGNLKGLVLNMVPSYPDLVSFLGTGPNAGGWNVMSYDLSNSAINCPTPSTCALDQQVEYYMATYAAAGIPANPGYEIGTPAYPPASTAASNQMPLSNALAGLIQSNTQTYYQAGFFWELFKPQGTNADVDVSVLAQSLCKQILGATTPRCSGSIPVLGDALLPGSSTTVTVTGPTGPKPPGPPTCYAPFNVATQYTAGMQCSYQGYNYVVAYYVNLGTLPTTPSAGWTQQGLCVSTSVATSAVVKTTTAVVKTTTAVVPPTTSTPAVTSAPATTTVVQTTAKTTTAVVVKTSTTAVVKTTTAVKPTTTAAAGGAITGTACSTNGGTQCVANVLYQCAYYTSTLTWGVWTTC
ncbi:hypothetical protein HDU98_007789 [Podochytrium sp. JEL0797]|nr:hypothetical protein HDU98_007789 [Podochytrium sp. JEL0797]